MKKINIFTVLAMILFLAACGSSSTTTTTGDTVAVTGTLGTGTVTNIGTKAITKSDTAASGYTVVAIVNDSNKTYPATTESDGSFSLSIPSGSTYVLSVINDGAYQGPIVFDGSGTEVNTAITPTAAVDLGSITLDAANNYARAATAPSIVNTSVTAVAADGVPVGAALNGKEQQTDIEENRTDSDKDKDGIPNFFDADEDNDGIRNGISGDPSTKAVVSDYVESVYMSSNIWADLNTTENAYDLIAMRLHVVPVAGQEGMISTVQCVDVPSAIESVAQVRYAESLADDWPTYPLGMPTELSVWQDDSFNLYKTVLTSQEQWIVSIKPAAEMSVGDTFTIRVTYTDATYEDFYVVLPYVLTDWSKIVLYNGEEMPTGGNQGDFGTSTHPQTFSGVSLEIIFSTAKDEDGVDLEGLTYSLTYGASTPGDSGAYAVAAGGTPATATEVTQGGITYLSATFDTVDGTTYYVAPVAEVGGQRNGEEAWFTDND